MRILSNGEICVKTQPYYMGLFNICVAAAFLTCSLQHVVDVLAAAAHQIYFAKSKHINIMYITMPIPLRLAMIEIKVEACHQTTGSASGHLYKWTSITFLIGVDSFVSKHRFDHSVCVCVCVQMRSMWRM